MRGLKFGSTSTTPIFGISGGATRGPREPRRNRALRDGTPPLDGVADAGRSAGGAEDAGMGGSFASSRSAAPTGSGAGGASEGGGAGGSPRGVTAHTPPSPFQRAVV